MALRSEQLAVNAATYARFGMAMIHHDTYAALGVW
jgi:hypothetical protein